MLLHQPLLCRHLRRAAYRPWRNDWKFDPTWHRENLRMVARHRHGRPMRLPWKPLLRRPLRPLLQRMRRRR
jgi:hypothetical protein